MADLINENVQTFAYSLIPNRGLPIDRSTVVKDEAELIEFVKRGWIVNGTKTFISAKGKSFTVLLDESKDNGFESIEELDSTQVTELATTIVEDYAPSKDELKEVSDKIVEVEGSVSTVRNELESQIAENSNQLNSFKSDYESDKEKYVTVSKLDSEISSVQESVNSIDLSPYALITNVPAIEQFNDLSITVSDSNIAIQELDEKLDEHIEAFETHVSSYNKFYENTNNSISSILERLVILEQKVADLAQEAVIAPKEFDFTVYIDNVEDSDNSAKYNKTITGVKPTWTDGSACYVTGIEVRVGDSSQTFTSPTKGSVLELTTPHVITDDVEITVIFTYSTGSEEVSKTVLCEELLGPSSVSILLKDNSGKQLGSDVNVGTVISSADVKFKAGDSTSYTVTVQGTDATANAGVGQSVTKLVDFDDITCDTVGNTVTIEYSIKDNVNSTVAEYTGSISVKVVEGTQTAYYGDVSKGSTITASEVSTLKTLQVKSGVTTDEVSFSDASSIRDYVVLCPEKLKVTSIKRYNDFAQGEEALSEFNIDTSTYTDSDTSIVYDIYRNSAEMDDSTFTISFENKD